MYDVKEVIKKLKEVSNSKNNVELAEKMEVGYDTLKAWIKRKTIGSSFDSIYKFCQKNNYSLNELFKVENSELMLEFNWVINSNFKGKNTLICINNAKTFVVFTIYKPMFDFFKIEKDDYFDIGFDFKNNLLAIRKTPNGIKPAYNTDGSYRISLALKKYPLEKHETITINNKDDLKIDNSTIIIKLDNFDLRFK